MKLQALVAAVGLITMASASANNEVLDFGNVGDSPGGTYFASGFIEHDVGSFTDQLKFSVLSPIYDLWNGKGNIADQPKADQSNIDGMTVGLFYDATGSGTYAPYADIGSGDYVSNGGPLQEGYYYFEVSGTATGPSPSSYTYSASVNAVPEPESYAMMLAGLGLLGAMARRRMRRE
jgi:PEP-CTERM motif